MNTIANPNEILYYIIEIKKYLQNHSKNETSIKFSEFNDKYPSIFKLIISGKDISQLYNMLYTIDNIRKNKITKEQADIKYGKILAEKYIPAEILNDKPPKSNNNNSDADT